MRSSFVQSPQVLVCRSFRRQWKNLCPGPALCAVMLVLAATQTVPIQSILAITFTNKATWAMKSRILDFLKRIALKQLKPFEAEDIIKPLGLDEDQASKLGLWSDE